MGLASLLGREAAEFAEILPHHHLFIRRQLLELTPPLAQKLALVGGETTPPGEALLGT